MERGAVAIDYFSSKPFVFCLEPFELKIILSEQYVRGTGYIPGRSKKNWKDWST